MAAEMVNAATSEKLKEMDWSKNIEICELVVRDHGQAKYVVKQLKKRFGNKNPNVQLFASRLLEMLVNNCGEHVHKEVIDNGLLPVLVKIVKKKTNLPVRERIFLLLDATQTAVGGASGKFPQYYSAYYELVSAGVEFPRRPHLPPSEQIISKEKPKDMLVEETLAKKFEDVSKQTNAQPMPDSSIIHKASSVLEILEDVLNALDPKLSEGATDEFVLDLVEQCSFQKQRVMHLVMTSGDERLVTQAIELNERLHKVLTQHDALLSVRTTSNTTFCATEDAEEEDAERLYRRMRKGKACAVDPSESPVGSFRSISEEQMRRPLIRPLCIQPSEPDSKPPPVFSIPPPPAKHVERERFFKEKHMDGTGLDGHMRGLSLDSRNGSSSRSGSTDFSERDMFGLRD